MVVVRKYEADAQAVSDAAGRGGEALEVRVGAGDALPLTDRGRPVPRRLLGADRFESRAALAA